MENLKIRTFGNENLSKAIQDVLFELGYGWGKVGYNYRARKPIHFIYADKWGLGWDPESAGGYFESSSSKEVTINDLFEMLREKRAQSEEKVLTPEQIREKFGIKSGTRVQISGIDVVI